jgi:prepilin-type N-terminal cleavage/methylation domain-containing protein
MSCDSDSIATAPRSCFYSIACRKTPLKNHRYHRPRTGFTLVELLVVISIIIVLAAMGFAGISRVIGKQKALVTQASVNDLFLAIDQYHASYGRLPNVGSQDDMTSDGQAGVALLRILLGKEDPGSDMQNPKGIAFLQTKTNGHKNQGGLIYSGNQIEGIYDAWGRPLNLRFDSDSDEEIPDPVQQGNIVRQKQVIIWSFGADGKLGDNDEVKSW